MQKMLWLLLGAVGLVLLIAISNVANLLLARASARAHELGIRTALGAERGRIIRQLLTESLMLSVSGGCLGIVLAYGAVHVLKVMNPGGIPRFESTTVDARVLVVAVLLAIGAGILAGVAPALSASKANVNDLLRRAGSRIAGGSNRMRFVLIVVDVALSVILLTGSGLLIRSYLQLAAVDPGFSPANLTFGVSLDDRYNTPQLQTTFYKNFLDKLGTLHGVRYVGAVNALPLSHNESLTSAFVQGFGSTPEMVERRSVTRDYRRALGTPLLRGRDFEAHDINAKNPVVMVNEKFAALYFPGRDPLGGHIKIGDLSTNLWSTVIGVIGNVRHTSLEEASRPQILQPAESGGSFTIACARPIPQLVEEVRTTLRSLDPTLTLDSVSTMGERMKQSNARRNFQTSLLTGFAAVAVALALAGLYGLMAYAVKQRTAEIGVRLALGSSRARILTLILSQGLRLTIAGLIIGLAGAFAVTRLLSAWLFGVTPADPITFLAVPFFILPVACVACVIPAWAATRIDPIRALRED